jgi:alkylhydroperoxidase family enzyme
VLEEDLVAPAEAGEFAHPGFTVQETMAIRYAETMHQDPHAMTQERVDELRTAFSDAEIVELGFSVAQFIGMGQLIHMLGLPNPSVAPVP